MFVHVYVYVHVHRRHSFCVHRSGFSLYIEGISAVYTEEISSVYTEEISSVYIKKTSSVYTEKTSSVFDFGTRSADTDEGVNYAVHYSPIYIEKMFLDISKKQNVCLCLLTFAVKL